MVKNCVKMDNIFCCFMLIIGVLGYILDILYFCGYGSFHGQCTFKILSETTFYINARFLL